MTTSLEDAAAGGATTAWPDADPAMRKRGNEDIRDFAIKLDGQFDLKAGDFLL